MSQYVDLEGPLVHQTEKAYLIDLGVHNEEDGEEGTWIPKSLCKEIEIEKRKVPLPPNQGGGFYEVEWISFQLPENVALDKGLI